MLGSSLFRGGCCYLRVVLGRSRNRAAAQSPDLVLRCRCWFENLLLEFGILSRFYAAAGCTTALL